MLKTNRDLFFSGIVLFVLFGLGLEIYANSDPDRLDWIDWWFWAKQNIAALVESQKIFGPVMSPVQGLFGQSYPLNPYFNPLWLLAASIDDPVIAHKVSSVSAYVLYALILWFLIKSQVKSKVLSLLALLLCINLYFDIVPVTEVYPLPKSNFNYFQLMPPQNFLMVLALGLLLVYLNAQSTSLRVIASLLIVSIGLIADPLYSLIYFAPVIGLLGLLYLQEFRTRKLEIVLCVGGIGILFLIGIAEYPLLLKDSIGRSVFNEYLFHHVKRHDDAAFAFQNKQNLVFILLSFTVLAWDGIRRGNGLSNSVLVMEVLFASLGVIYLSTNMNLNYLPGLHALESTAVPIYIVATTAATERLITNDVKKVKAGIEILCGVGLCLFIVGKVLTADFKLKSAVQSFYDVPLLTEERPSHVEGENYKGSVSLILGSPGSRLARLHDLPDRFGMKTVVFSQNNEHASQFFGNYKRSSALVSYWLRGVQTLEENNHMTDPFYLYFFRNLFMNETDYYVSNMNLFTVPRLNLYPILGVRELVTDRETQRSVKFEIGEVVLFKTRFSNYNRGQYAPRNRIGVSSGRDALRLLTMPSFDPLEDYVVNNQETEDLDLSGTSEGMFFYENNSLNFVGRTTGKALHVLPLLFSNCLYSEERNNLVRVNLILTGIVFRKDTSDRISYRGPPFDNDCIKADRKDAEKYNLRDRQYSYPKSADKSAIREFLSSPWH